MEEPIDIKAKEYRIQPKQNKYPLTIVWSHLYFITQLFPFIGQTGIGDLGGDIHHFMQDGTVCIDTYAYYFGETQKYIRLDLEDISKE